ncbi:MAG: endonuclease/exonuclease/phosphatase family protein [Chitinispirillaceae bacterium]|jgi:endonuclease/exonuclease/phosphatase family metal-dependent hydrolase
MFRNRVITDRNVFFQLLDRSIWFSAFAATILIFIGCNRCSSPDKTGVPATINVSDTIAIGFYNVENLFDLNYDGDEYPEYRPGALGWNKQTWEKKVYNIASAIAAMNVAVIGLCEVENRNALEGLRKELGNLGAEYPYSAIADIPSHTVTCPALLSKLPVTRWQGFGPAVDAPIRRNILEADVDCGRTSLKIFVNHWPSKAHPESQRIVMAQVLAKRIAQLPAQTGYIIMGDLNADYDEWCKFHTEGLDDTKGVTGLNHLLKTVHGGPGNFLSYVNKQEMAAADSSWLYDLWLELPESRRCSRMYQGHFETPDHILLPPALFRASGISYCDKSFEAFTWNGALLRNNEPFSWQMSGFGKRRFHTGEGYSDHLPVRACFAGKPFAFAAQSSHDSSVKNKPSCGTSAEGGFERSMEGWLACGQGIDVSRDSSMPAAGRYCLRIQGNLPPDKNCCIARTILRRDALNRSRWAQIMFDFRGSGKLLLRVRSGKGRWRYYVGPAFASSGSARYLPVSVPSWKHFALSFTYDNLASQDLSIEIHSAKGLPFRFYVDNVAVK